MTTKPLLAQFGAGNIGRSLVGQLFANAGWEVVFLDVDQAVVDALNRRHAYRITVKDDLLPGQPGHIDVANVSGIDLRDREAALAALARADLIGSSVGAANLKSVCGLIAEALAGRTRPLSALLCENLHDAARLAGEHLRGALPPDFPLDERIGLVEAAIGKMVPYTPPEVRKADPLAVWAEAYNTLYLDADACLGTPPTVFGVAWRRPFQAYVDRKLFQHNFGHAAAAFHGHLAGKTYIWEAMSDPGVAAEVAGCMFETARALAARHADVFTFDENRASGDDLMRRFRNQALADPVFRVGRDLGRKLAPADRCIGSLRLMAETGTPYAYSARAVAAGLLFAAVDEDGRPYPGDREIVAEAAAKGPEAVLAGLCGLDPDREADLIRAVADAYRHLARTGQAAPASAWGKKQGAAGAS